jgi:hypothetical protein
MTQRNEGEGNKSAARRYNQAAQQFAHSGRVKKQAAAAREAIDGPEKKDLRKAEAIGKSHAKK